MNVYQILRELSASKQVFKACGNMNTTLPYVPDFNRIVKTNFDRGTSMWGVKLASEKPEVYITMRDNKTHNVEENCFHWTSFMFSAYKNGQFDCLNNLFEARITRSLFDKLVNANICQKAEVDLNKLVTLNLKNVSLFPVLHFDEEYLSNKLSLLDLQAKIKDLRYLKGQALKYFREHGISFEGMPEKKEREYHPEWIKVVVPFLRYTVQILNIPELAGINMNEYRTKVGRSYVYNQENYSRIISEISELESQIKVLQKRTRLVELSVLEHGTQEEVTLGFYRIRPVLEMANEEFRCPKGQAEFYLKKNPQAYTIE